ncbi:MAG: ATP-binding protein [Mucilaginibacter sp.]|nr:ATP-binding protein [Mucilaginibacter sp.]
MKFTPAGGTINICSATNGDNCTIIITDTGSGISFQQLHTLFDGNPQPTYGTDNEKGVGLGLMICKEFMEHQSGRITAESKLGKGSTFTIEIPLAVN